MLLIYLLIHTDGFEDVKKLWMLGFRVDDMIEAAEVTTTMWLGW